MALPQVLVMCPWVDICFGVSQVMREQMQMALNPSLRREHMRNADRAISNIESHPEGFNALRRMYENVQEPLLDAATAAAHGEDNRGAANPFASLFSSQQSNTTTEGNGTGTMPNTAPLPNPWGDSQPAANRGLPGMPPLGLDGIGGVGSDPFGLGMDPAAISQIMQNPAMQQMMQQMVSRASCLLPAYSNWC